MDPEHSYYPYITFSSFALIAFLNILHSGRFWYRLDRCGLERVSIWWNGWVICQCATVSEILQSEGESVQQRWMLAQNMEEARRWQQ